MQFIFEKSLKQSPDVSVDFGIWGQVATNSIINKIQAIRKIGNFQVLKEYQVLNALNQNNIDFVPKVFSFKEIGQNKYELILEYLDYPSLAEIIELDYSTWFSIPLRKEGSKNQKHSAIIAKNIKHAFLKLYNIGVFYRDINLQHILVGPNNKIFLIDFGASIIDWDVLNKNINFSNKPSKALKNTRVKPEFYNINTTDCNHTIGTWELMSPNEFEARIGAKLTKKDLEYVADLISFQIANGFSKVHRNNFLKDNYIWAIYLYWVNELTYKANTNTANSTGNNKLSYTVSGKINWQEFLSQKVILNQIASLLKEFNNFSNNKNKDNTKLNLKDKSVQKNDTDPNLEIRNKLVDKIWQNILAKYPRVADYLQKIKIEEEPETNTEENQKITNQKATSAKIIEQPILDLPNKWEIIKDFQYYVHWVVSNN